MSYLISIPDQPVEVRLEGETLWLSLLQLADLFGRDKSVISYHLKNIFEAKELDRGAVVVKNSKDGKTCQVGYYNLDTIISVGYWVNSLDALYTSACPLRPTLKAD